MRQTFLFERHSGFWAQGLWDMIAPQLVSRDQMLITGAALSDTTLYVRVADGGEWELPMELLSGVVHLGEFNLMWPVIAPPTGYTFECETVLFPPSPSRSRIAQELRRRLEHGSPVHYRLEALF